MKQVIAAVAGFLVMSIGIQGIAYVNTNLLGIDLSQFSKWKQFVHDVMPALLGIFMAFVVKWIYDLGEGS